MKKTLVLLSLCAGSVFSFAQTKQSLAPALQGTLPSRQAQMPTGEKSLLCLDTLRYPQAKEQILGTSNFYTFDIWQSDNEGFSQAYLNSGSLSVRGIEFFGANNTTDGTASVTVTASLYNVNASYVPTTLITSGTVSFSSTTPGYHYVNFGAPATVTGNYAVVIQATNAGGVFTTYVNDAAPNQTYDELFARFKSSYSGYASSGGNWITIPAFTEIGNNNFEALISPLVSYTINTAFTPSATTVCQGTAVTFTNATTPTAILGNRMENYQIFRTYFGTAPSDSTFVYDMDNGSPYIWSGTTTYTHPAAGSYDVLLGTNGGFWNSCFDFTTHTITVNPLPAAPTITAGGATTFCSGGSVTLTSSAASGNTWSTGATTQSITVNSGGNYTVTTTASGCTSPASAATSITITPLDDASFSYSSSTLCSGGANETPTAAVTGTYSSTTGLNFVSNTTGEIDMSTSADGTYAITHTTNGTCPNTSTQNITITSAPDASFSYAQSSYCALDADPSVIFGTGASGGSFTSTTGLMINSGTGVIDLSGSMAGTYTVTNTIAAAGACPMVTETFDVTVVGATTTTVAAGGTYCAGDAIPALPTTSTNGVMGTWSPSIDNMASATYTFTPNAGQCATSASATITVNPVIAPAFAAGGTYCAGDAISDLPTTSTNGVNGTWTPAINNTATTTYTFAPDAGQCASAATTTIAVNPLPTVTFGAIAQLCVYNSPITLTQGAPAGGSYAGTGVTGTQFDPASAGLGTANLTYSYTDGNGCSNTANSSVVVDACAGIEEAGDLDVTIAPNPASESFVITSNGIDNLSYSVVTNDGRLVVARKNMINGVAETVNVQGFAKGIYFVQLSSGTQTTIKKIIVE